MIESPVDVLKRELDTLRGTFDHEAESRDNCMRKVRAYDARLAQHSRLMTAMLLAIETLEAK